MGLAQIEEDIREAFIALDHVRLTALADALEDPPDDAARVALAFGLLGSEQRTRADGLLAAVEGDGTCPLGDFAYVRAFRCELDEDWEGVAATLLHHLDREDSTHRGAMRLRVGEAFLNMNQAKEVATVLEPLLQPPGVPETLEAYLILIEAELQDKADKEKLVEYGSIVDGLLERGHVLDNVVNVVYYANLFDSLGMDGVVEPLLRTHERILDQYVVGDEEDVHFLLAAGEKYKVPSAVRAAARSYASNPFPFRGDPDPEKAAYLFASHEEHEGARLVFLHSYKRSAIDKYPAIWGPLLISSYHAERWKEALALVRKHRTEIRKLPIAAHGDIIRIVCEYYLGRFSEAWQHFEEMGLEEFLSQADFLECAVLVFLCWADGREEAAIKLGREILEARREDKEFIRTFLPRGLTELLLRDRADLMESWMQLFLELSPPGFRIPNLIANGLAAFEWGMPEGVQVIAGMLKEEGEVPMRGMLLGILAAESGDERSAEKLFSSALENVSKDVRGDILLQRALTRRRHFRGTAALEDVDEIVAMGPEYPRRHMALALKAGTLRYLDEVPKSETEPLLQEALGHVARHASNPDMRAIGEAEISYYFHGTSPDVLLANAKASFDAGLGSTEELRLARRVLMAFDRRVQEEVEATRIRDGWISRYLQPEWPDR